MRAFSFVLELDERIDSCQKGALILLLDLPLLLFFAFFQFLVSLHAATSTAWRALLMSKERESGGWALGG